MKTNFCQAGHQVWWARLNGITVAFVQTGRGFRLDLDSVSGELIARQLVFCYRPHSDVCKSTRFLPGRHEIEERRKSPRMNGAGARQSGRVWKGGRK